MKRLTHITMLLLLILSCKSSSAQTTATIKGRVIGQAMEELEGVTIVNVCHTEMATSNSRGFFQIKAAKGDTLIFISSKYSQGKSFVKHLTDNVNVVMITRKTAALPIGFTDDDFRKAAREDEKLYDILEKGAERNGTWIY
jgi:hypothetical protein